MSDPRFKWQSEALDVFAAHKPIDFLFYGTTGCGKTRFGLSVIQYMIDVGKDPHTILTKQNMQKVLIVSPTKKVVRQWRDDAHKYNDIELLTNPDYKVHALSPHYLGLSVTYQALQQNWEWFRWFCNYYRVLVICDEPHHMSDNLAWGEAAGKAFKNAIKRLLLTGTPIRSDGTKVTFFKYDNGYAVPDHRYLYGRALNDEVCRAMSFPTLDGEVDWNAYGKRYSMKLSDNMTQAQIDDALRTCLTIPEWSRGDDAALRECWVFKMLTAALQKLEYLRRGDFPDSALLIPVVDINHGHQVRDILREYFHVDPEFVHSKDEDDAVGRLDVFRNSDRKVLISVQMVTEGVDIPRIRVIGWATNRKTLTSLEQIAGRARRRQPNSKRADGTVIEDSHAWMFFPPIKPYVEYAQQVEKEVKLAIKEKEEKVVDFDFDDSDGDGTGEKNKSYEHIRSSGVVSDTIYRSDKYSVTEMRMAAAFRAKHGLLNKTVEEVAVMIADMMGRSTPDLSDTLGDLAFDPSPFDGPSTPPAVPSPNSDYKEPLEVRIKAKRKKCHELACEIVKIKCQKYKLEYNNEEKGSAIRSLHDEWFRKSPNNHYQTDATITEDELDRKIVWLESVLSQVKGVSND